jgi:nucleotide-binding universal stress UspA family protein
MYSRILVPLDGTALSESILPHSSAVASRFDATLVLLRVSISEAEAMRQTVPGEPLTAAPLAMDMADQLVEVSSTAAEAYLGRIVQGLAASKLRCEALVMDGDPVLALRQAVKEQRIDLVTMATHGRSSLGRLVQGSVAEDLLHVIGVPVLMLHVRT